MRKYSLLPCFCVLLLCVCISAAVSPFFKKRGDQNGAKGSRGVKTNLLSERKSNSADSVSLFSSRRQVAPLFIKSTVIEKRAECAAKEWTHTGFWFGPVWFLPKANWWPMCILVALNPSRWNGHNITADFVITLCYLCQTYTHTHAHTPTHTHTHRSAQCACVCGRVGGVGWRTCKCR